VNVAGLDPTILGPAFLTGLLVLATHVPLGRRVLERGIVFLDLAVAQVAAAGGVAAQLAGIEGGIAQQLAALAAALVGAYALYRCERRWPEIQEAVIGATFVVAASAVMLLLAGAPHGGEHLQDVLAGQILWVGWDQLVPAAVVSAGVLAVWLALRGRPAPGLFYAAFAVSVTVSVQLVGVYLVFASLILPALAARGHGLVRGFAVGTGGYAGGLLASGLLDLPAGPAVVCALALTALLGGAPGGGGQRASR
jgi:zinc/manganese transport system permease protein